MSKNILGEFIAEPAERDAVHVAVCPVRAGEDLELGQQIGFIGVDTEVVGASDHPVGVVDPFLPHAPRRGDRFYMLVTPNRVVSLRHDWKHPDFDTLEVPKSVRDVLEEWLRDLGSDVWTDVPYSHESDRERQNWR